MLIKNILLLFGVSLFSHCDLCNGFVSKQLAQSIIGAHAGADIDRALGPPLSMTSTALSASSDDGSTDVIICGGGFAGLSAAHYIRTHSDLSVMLLERETPEQQRCATTSGSFAAAGALGAQTEGLEEGSPLLNMCTSSRAMYPEWLKTVEEDASAADEGVKTKYGVSDDAGYLPNQVWVLRVGGAATELLPGSIDARRATCILRAACDTAGVQLKLGEEWQVESLIKKESLAKEGGICSGVKLTNGDYLSAKTVICANGAFVSTLLEGVTVTPSKGQSAVVRLPEGSEPLEQAEANSKVYVMPKSDGRILIGATIEPGKFDGLIDEKLDDILLDAKKMVPSLQNCVIEERFAGLRPMSTDGCPIMGEIEGLENTFVSGGYCTFGVLLAPKAGELIGKSVINKLASDDEKLMVSSEDQEFLDAFSPSRDFSEFLLRLIIFP